MLQLDHGLHTYLKYFANRVEEPTVGIDLLLVLGLDYQDDGDRYQVAVVVSMRKDELWCGIYRELRRILDN